MLVSMRLVADTRERLDHFLVRHLPQFTRSRLAELISAGGVTVNGKPSKPGLPLKEGMVVELEPPADRPAHDLTPFDLALDVVFEDAHLMIVNKPRGLAVHPAPTLNEPSLVNVLLARGGALSEGTATYRPGIVHRLDKETTGLLVVAKTDRAHQILARQFAAKKAERRYLAVVSGDLEKDRLTIDAPLGRDKRNRLLMAVDPHGKPAVTHILKIGRHDLGALVVARLETGRTHQIRIHLKAVGHPVLGDRLYAPPEKRDGPMLLHAAYMELDHPETGERLKFWAPSDWSDTPREAVEFGWRVGEKAS